MAKKKTSGQRKTAKAAPPKKVGRKAVRKHRHPAGSQPGTCDAGGFPIVGVGASAGGFDAVKRLLEATPDDPGFALVIVQHLDPTRKSLAPELLAKATRLQVVQVEDDPRVKPGCVYVIPPGKYLSISEGTLHLSEPDKPRGARMAVDFFLRSLAKDQEHCAVGVILSGTGTDGTLGIKAVKAAGGLIIAQEPTTAEFGGMPYSALATGIVDHILPVDQIPEVLVRYARHPYVREFVVSGPTKQGEQPAPPEESDGLPAVIALLRSRTGHDFATYKERTLVRRTQRRMGLHHLEDYDAYLKRLREHPEELDALAKDLLISVTDFFREPDAWEQLRVCAIRPIIESKPIDEPIRVWVPGCATGEEPYSAAMVILEELGRAAKICPLHVFASDIDKEAIEYARVGRYPRSIEADVSRERLKRFFTSTSGGELYEVNKGLREAVVFAEQHLIADPPFSKLDLLCCRNLLIYLKADVQEKVIAMFHFALREGGTLFLGSAETVARQTDLFETVDKRWRIFRRSGPTRHELVDIPISKFERRREVEPRPSASQRRDTHLALLAQQRLLDLVAPAAVLVDATWRILYIYGDVDPYLAHRPGPSQEDLLEKARQGLRSKLRGAVHTALAENRTVSLAAQVRRNSGFQPVCLTVRVIHDSQLERNLALVLFEEDGAAPDGRGATPEQKQRRVKAKGLGVARRRAAAGDAQLHDHAVIRQLEEELGDAKDDLQAAVEQLEASNEEYRASNEEVMSVNEELQSTNEELETSKEELQSMNEELSTVNSQLADKVEQLETKQADLQNLLAVTNVATIFLDTDLTVRLFTPAAQEVIRLKAHDLGRALADLSHDFQEDDLVEVAQRVLKDLAPVEDEVACDDGRALLRRVTPYRADDHRIGGVVVTFVDITRRKRNEQSLRESEERLRLATEGAQIGTWDWDLANDLVTWSAIESKLVGRDPDMLRSHVREFFDRVHPDDRPSVTRNVDAAIEGEAPYDHEFRVVLADGRIRWLAGKGEVLRDRDGKPRRMMGVNFDITQRKRLEIELQKLNESLEEQVAERTGMLGVLQDVTRSANEARTVEEAMLAALARIAEYNGWQVGHVWRLAEDGSNELVDSDIWYVTDEAPRAVARLGEFQQVCAQTRFPWGQPIVGAVAESGQPVWIDDIAGFPDWRRGDAGHLGLHATIAFPITANDEVVAVLEYFSDHTVRREDRFMEIMPDVGIQLGHVIERKRLQKLIADATEREQRRIGRDIHDGIGQELTGLRYLAQTHAESLAECSSSEARVAERIAAGLADAQEQLRTVIRQLVPVEVDEKGLVEALRGLARQTSDFHDVACTLESSDDIAVGNNLLATHVYRIVQEAVSNAVRHAGARQIAIRLAEHDGELQWQVVDDGRGIGADWTSRGGFGMHSMAYRAELIGGRLLVEPGERGGTAVRCSVPLGKRSKDD